MTAAEIMDASAVLLNDASKTNFTYAKQIPFLNIALGELQEFMEENNAPITNKTSSALTVAVGVTALSFSTTPALPSDLIEIQEIYERQSGVNEDYFPVKRMEFLPEFVVAVEALQYWAWINEQVVFVGATTVRQIKIDYVKSIFSTITTSADTITMLNARSFLNFRTAGLCAQFIGENETRASELNADAGTALERTLNINAKGRQSIATRRRPFQANYRSRGIY